jgi:fucose permease
MLGLALTVAGLCLLAVAPNYGALLAAVAVMGVAAGVLDMVLSPIVSALRPNARGSALNWLHSFYCIGALGTVMIGSGAIHWGISWRAVSLALAAVPAVLLVLFSALTIPALVHRDAVRMPLRGLLCEPFFLAALLAIALAGATEQGMAQWVPAFTERGLGYSKTIGALSLAGFSFGMIAGRMTAAMIQRHIRVIPMMIGGCVLSVFLFGVACFYANAPVALAACILVGFSGSCLWPTTLAVTANRCPHGGATMFALLSAAGNGGCFVMAWLVGIVAMYSDLNLGLATTALCPAVLVFVLVWMGARGVAAESVDSRLGE